MNKIARRSGIRLAAASAAMIRPSAAQTTGKDTARSMTTIKLLSTGLIAIAMLTTSALARENFAAERKTRVIIRGGTANAPCGPGYIRQSAPAGCWIVWEGIPIWFGPSVRGVPGHICDFGNNPMIC